MSGSPAGVETPVSETQKEISAYGFTNRYPGRTCPFRFCPVCATPISAYLYNPVKSAYTVRCSQCDRNIEIYEGKDWDC